MIARRDFINHTLRAGAAKATRRARFESIASPRRVSLEPPWMWRRTPRLGINQSIDRSLARSSTASALRASRTRPMSHAHQRASAVPARARARAGAPGGGGAGGVAPGF